MQHFASTPITSNRRDFVAALAAGLATLTAAGCDDGSGAHLPPTLPPPKANLKDFEGFLKLDGTAHELYSDTTVQEFAAPIPDSAWRDTFKESYRQLELISDMPAIYNQERQRLKETLPEGVDLSEAQEDYAAAAAKREFQKRYQEWERNFAPLESGGEIFFSGDQIVRDLGHKWAWLPCNDYCFRYLLRDPAANTHSTEAVPNLIARGYFPVKTPKDFDVVAYGTPQETETGSVLDVEHWGMFKDGKVISKDIMSSHVYKHPVEEAAGISTHVMFFRNFAGSLPSERPLPEAPIGYHCEDVEGIAVLKRDIVRPWMKIASAGFVGFWGLRVLFGIGSDSRKGASVSTSQDVPSAQ